MGFIKKAIFVLLIFAALYFAGQQIGLLVAGQKLDFLQGGGTLAKVAGLDAEYGLAAGQVVPGANLDAYAAKLGALQLRSEDEKNVVNLKLEFTTLTKSLSAFSALSAKMTGPNQCPNGPQLLSAYNDAMLHANNAKQISAKMGTVKGFESLSEPGFGAGLGLTISALNETMDTYYTLC